MKGNHTLYYEDWIMKRVIIPGNMGPRQMLFDALAFEKHAKQIREKRGETISPIWYERVTGYGTYLDLEKIKGDGDVLYFPSFETQKDYEFEIAGLCLGSIQTKDVREAVRFIRDQMLFTVFNDTSCRAFQTYDMMLPLWIGFSKGIADKAFGTRWKRGSDLAMDENGVFKMDMQLCVNDTVVCEDNFQSIYFTDPLTGARRAWGFAQIIAWFGQINQGFVKGDIIGSGTIGNGSIADAFPQQEWLKEGDVISMTTEGLGTLTNIIGVKEMFGPKTVRT